jgi:D-3-phosphoglycerate dehydrogenase / 2-oxoglutarate reductase
MKIFIADKLSPKTVAALEQLGAAVTVNAEVKDDELGRVLADTEVLIVRSKKVSAAAIAAAPQLSLIIRAGAGVNTIDLFEASRRGIFVANCPGKNTDAVAELTIGLLVAADRRIADATTALRAGRWRKKEYGKAHGLKGRTLGVIGFGAIGAAVARRAQGLDMKVIAWSRSLTTERAAALGIGACTTPLEVAERADAVTVHLAAAKETDRLIGREFLERMKPGAILLNTARGDVIDGEALKWAIREKKLRVGLDVFVGEPAGGEAEFADRELAGLVTATPHIGASTAQAEEAIADEVVRIVQTYQETGRPANTVNLRARSTAVTNLVVRHYNRVGVLAGILDELRNEGVNIEEMENTIFEGGLTASCSLRLDDRPSEALLAKARANPNIIQASVNV